MTVGAALPDDDLVVVVVRSLTVQPLLGGPDGRLGSGADGGLLGGCLEGLAEVKMEGST